MQNFIFDNPTKVIFGKEAENNIAEEINKFYYFGLLHFSYEVCNDYIIKFLIKKFLFFFEWQKRTRLG